ncbi:hypothetical protein GYMLUDRAFT_582301 [Collybiopsis luxurians FD-317 M1]|uniref:Uncharacterized protein n=1 Tax=Collybiopsis luxurians FD-317 M1 TaxID=944289 RepID=A0A0D0CFN8_9AGAR|nr:hypothetical protein GYMLUDRAFT_582301 [Collybiopsis luxurians FD-317 M1]
MSLKRKSATVLSEYAHACMIVFLVVITSSTRVFELARVGIRDSLVTGANEGSPQNLLLNRGTLAVREAAAQRLPKQCMRPNFDRSCLANTIRDA